MTRCIREKATEDEEEEKKYERDILDPEVDPPLPSRAAKPLPDEERAARMERFSSAKMAEIILECSRVVEKVAATSGNLKSIRDS